MNGKLKIVECKTYGEKIDKAKKSHYHQLKTYCSLMGIDGILLYIGREPASYNFSGGSMNAELKAQEFPYYYSHQDAVDVFTDILLANQSYKLGIIPPIEAHFKKSHCSSDYHCPFYNKCWGSEIITNSAKELMLYEKLRDECIIEANRLVNETEQRRNGILHFMEIRGNSSTKNYLKTKNWKEMI